MEAGEFLPEVRTAEWRVKRDRVSLKFREGQDFRRAVPAVPHCVASRRVALSCSSRRLQGVPQRIKPEAD